MLKRASDVIIFVLSVIAFSVSLIMLRMYGAYEIAYGDETLVVDGGWLMIVMNISRLIVLFVLCILSGIKLYKSVK